MAEPDKLLADYQRLRQALRQLANLLMTRLPQGSLLACGQQLGLSITTRGLDRPLFVFDDEYEMFVLMDYCLYHARHRGRTVIERYLADSPPALGSDELALLHAMLQVRYSLLEVESTEPGVGAHTRDLLRDEPVFVVDIQFSRTASPGLVLAGNIVSPGGLSMTTGAMLPVDQRTLEALAEQLLTQYGASTAARFRLLSPEQQSELATLVIRACLAAGAASTVQAEDVPLKSGGPASLLSSRPSRNAPCPCGSGKKYKRCCGQS